MKALCIGESLQEITCPINVILNEGMKLRIQEKYECSAGHAGNVAYLLGKWGVETYIASMLGADDAANNIKKDFENIGVKVDYIETSYDKPTGKSVVMVNVINKNTTIADIASNSNLKKYAFAIEPDIIVADGNDFSATVAAFDKFKNAKSFLMVTRNNNEVVELCKYVNYVVFNREMAEVVAGLKIDYNDSSTLVNLYNKLKQKYSSQEIVVTLGERGCMYSVNSQVKILPPVKVDIIDTNGAGDTFIGAFAFAIGRGFDLEKSVTYATIAASFSTTKFTSRLSIPAITEVTSYYDNKFGTQNNEVHNNVQTANMNTTVDGSLNNDNSQNA